MEELDVDLDLMVYFASCGKPSKYGSWGLIEAMDQPREEAYKYQAVQDFDASGKMGRGVGPGRKGRAQYCCHFQEYERNKRMVDGPP